MKRFLAAMTPAFLALVLAACGTQGASPTTHYGDHVRTVAGTIGDYPGESAIVHAYSGFDPDHGELVGSGTIAADGAFELSLLATLDASDSTSWFCGNEVEGNDAVMGIEIVMAPFVMAPSPYVSDEFVVAGQLVLTDADAPAEGFSAGDGVAVWIYSAEDQQVDRSCQSGYTVELDLRRGWNTGVALYGDALGVTSLSTGAAPSGYEWVWVAEPSR